MNNTARRANAVWERKHFNGKDEKKVWNLSTPKHTHIKRKNDNYFLLSLSACFFTQKNRVVAITHTIPMVNSDKMPIGDFNKPAKTSMVVFLLFLLRGADYRVMRCGGIDANQVCRTHPYKKSHTPTGCLKTAAAV